MENPLNWLRIEGTAAWTYAQQAGDETQTDPEDRRLEDANIRDAVNYNLKGAGLMFTGTVGGVKVEYESLQRGGEPPSVCEAEHE